MDGSPQRRSEFNTLPQSLKIKSTEIQVTRARVEFQPARRKTQRTPVKRTHESAGNLGEHRLS